MNSHEQGRNPPISTWQGFTQLFFIFLCSSFATSIAVSNSDDSGPVVQTTPLVSFLQRVQITAQQSYARAKKIAPDPKFYIDLSLKLPHNLSSVESVFDDLRPRDSVTMPVEMLEKFVNEYLDIPGVDIVPHEPEDFVSNPTEFLLNVENNQVREWAREVHGLWKILSKKVTDSVREAPDRHTLLPLPEPVIIPGSRFREVYYWDSYWIIKSAFQTIFWNEKAGQWLDYWLSSNDDEPETWKAENQNSNVFASNFAPIWIHSFYSDTNLVKKVLKALENSGLIAPAGILASLTNSAQQWDSPNGWAPQQDMIVTGLARSGLKEAKEVAEEIARRWIRSSYRVYKTTGSMHEKLNVLEFGKYGGGGDYKPQTGFGWSNGVILSFLEELGWPSHLSIEL